MTRLLLLVHIPKKGSLGLIQTGGKLKELSYEKLIEIDV